MGMCHKSQEAKARQKAQRVCEVVDFFRQCSCGMLWYAVGLLVISLHQTLWMGTVEAYAWMDSGDEGDDGSEAGDGRSRSSSPQARAATHGR